MKRIISLLLATLLCLLTLPINTLAEEKDGALAFIETAEITMADSETVSAQEGSAKETAAPAEEGIKEDLYTQTSAPDGETITLDDYDEPIDTVKEDSQSIAESEAEAVSPADTELTDEESAEPVEYVISGKDIDIENGNYSYQLVVKETGELIFDNDLEINYQDVDGCYKLHYEIAEADNHIMIVTGTFDNIMVASPLLKKISDRISEDSYFHQLDLRTNEGFTFENKLQFLFDGAKHGYTINYGYDLATNNQTFDIKKISD